MRMCRAGQNHIYIIAAVWECSIINASIWECIYMYTVYIRYFWQGNHQIYGVYIRIYMVYGIRLWPTLRMCELALCSVTRTVLLRNSVHCQQSNSGCWTNRGCWIEFIGFGKVLVCISNKLEEMCASSKSSNCSKSCKCSKCSKSSKLSRWIMVPA